jgi:hypothetical protein
MEEILASIRRIIADDDASKSPARPPEPVPPPVPVAQQQPRPAPPPAPRPVAAVPPPPRPVPPPPAPPVETVAKQDEIEAMLSDLNKAQEAAAGSAADVLDLTESMAAPHADGFRTIDGQSDIVFDDDPDESSRKPEVEERPLMSSVTSAAVDSAFNSLAHTVLVQNARTLEDLVREMLRPLLKTWLDDNLPGLVERLVRAEIERVSRGRG